MLAVQNGDLETDSMRMKPSRDDGSSLEAARSALSRWCAPGAAAPVSRATGTVPDAGTGWSKDRTRRSGDRSACEEGC